MGAKFKSKTHLQNTFFDFLSRFLRVWLQSLKKVLIWQKKIWEFHADFESVEKVVKKVISKTSLTNMSKSENSAFFRHVFANYFFWYIFSNLFQRIRNQREILRFLTPFSIFSPNFFYVILVLRIWPLDVFFFTDPRLASNTLH